MPFLSDTGTRAGRSASPALALLTRLALLAGAAACSEPPSAPVDVPGKVLSIAIDSSLGPILRAVTVTVDQPAPAEVVYGAPGTPVLRVAAESLSTVHRFVLPRLRASKAYELEAGVHGGSSAPVRGTFGTGALPADIAAIDIDVTGTPSMPVSLIEVAGAPTFQGLLMVEEGEVVGWQRIDGALFGMTRRQNGNLVLLESTGGLIEFRLDGTIAHRLPQPTEAPQVAYGRMHHDLAATPRNTILFIANEVRAVGSDTVTGEALWEWSPETGSVTRRWSAFDHLDWDVLRGARTQAGNWLHGNGISHGARGNVIMSLRNVDQVISIAPDFSQVEWSLGGTNGTLAVAAADRFWGQHYATEPSADRLLVYDNGFDRPEGLFTRAVEYQIDRSSRKATKVWEYRHSPDIYASLVGSARRLPNGNTVVLFGMLAGQSASTGPITTVEVTPAGAVQWRMSVGPQLTRLYRVTPLPSLVGEQPAAFRPR